MNKDAYMKITLLALVGFFVVAVVLYIGIQQRLLGSLTSIIQNEEQLQREYSTHLANNTAPGDVASYYTDCKTESRSEYERLLSIITTLSIPELEKLDQLFVECAYFYPVQQGIVLTKLKDLNSTYTKHIALYDSLWFDNVYAKRADVWEQIIKEESLKHDLTRELVAIQKSIIEELRKGTPKENEAIESQRSRADEILVGILTARNELNRLQTELSY